jgi:hypothetical protein
MKVPNPETEPERFADWALSMLVRYHGEERARQLLAKRGRKPGRRFAGEMTRHVILARYDFEPNVDKLARELVAEGFKKTLEGAESYIYDSLNRRRIAMKHGKWRGPVPPEGAKQIPKTTLPKAKRRK